MLCLSGPLTAAAVSVAVTLTIPSSGTPAITVLPTSSTASPLLTSESGGQTLVLVSLSTAPTATVTIPVTNPNPAEVTVSTSSLVFTPADWTPRSLLITGVDDAIADGDVLVAIGLGPVTGSSNYAGATLSDVIVQNLDDETPAFTVTPTGVDTVVSESGSIDRVDVVLSVQPAGTVTIAIAPGAQLLSSPTSLTFTPANWNVAQSATFSAIDDTVSQGTRTVNVAFTASGGGYTGAAAVSSPVTILDNDSATIDVSPTSGLIVDEAGRQAVFTVRLGSRPSSDVVIPIASGDLSEGTVSPASLTFTSANWSTAQTVTVTGVADNVADGDQLFTIAVAPALSGDTAYSGLDPSDPSVTCLDGDVAALVVSPTSAVTNETGTTATIRVRLATIPVASVTVTASSSNTGEVTVSGALTFTSATWNTDQSITLTGVDDLVPDGNQTVTVLLTPSGDAAYAALSPTSVSVVNQDDEVATLLISQSGPLALAEGSASTASYGLRLSKAPTAAVTVTPTPDTQLALASASPLIFTASDWNVIQTVTVSVVNDAIAEGTHQGTVSHAVSSPDGAYNGLPTQVVAVAITDNDSPGIAASATSGFITTEIGGSATATIVLQSQPTAQVRIPIVSSDTSQGTVAPAQLLFDASTWNVPQVVTLTGADGNGFDDGDVDWQATLGPAISSDTFYNGRSGPTLFATNRAVDNPPTLNPLSDLALLENPGTQTVALSGISTGQAGEIQTIALSATTSDASVTGALTLTYTSPQSTGTLSFTPTGTVSGSATVAVTVSDGTSTLTRSFVVSITAVNDAPVLVRVTTMTVTYRGSGAWQGLQASATAPAQLAASDQETANAALIYRVLLLPARGRIALDGTALAVNATVTQAMIDAGRVTYTHSGGPGTSDGVVFRIEDADGGQTTPFVADIAIDRAAPAIDLLPDPAPSFTENGAAIAIAAAALVDDLDSATFNGGELRIRQTSGGASGDALSVLSTGNNPGEIAVAGSTISYGGTAIGSLSGGAWPSDLVVAFNLNSSTAAAQALLRAVQFLSTSENPGSSTRLLGIAMTDDNGDASAEQLWPITVIAVNDAPVASDLTFPAIAGSAVAATAAATDPDGPSLTWTVSSAPSKGTITTLDASTGAFTYVAAAGQSGTDTFVLSVSDGSLNDTATITAVISGPSSAERLWVISDPPSDAAVGDLLRFTVEVDASELTTTPTLAFSLIGAPAGMTIATDALTGTGTVTWTVAAGADRHVAFSVLAYDTLSLSADLLPVLLYVVPLSPSSQ